jgi:hypothetical protein
VPSPSLVLEEITIDCTEVEAVARFWSSMLGAELRVPRDGWLRLGPLTDDRPVINFQPVPEPKRGKARLHLDLWTIDLDQAIALVENLGGRSLDQRHVYNEGTVVVMADPEVHEFCLVGSTLEGA